MHVGDRIEGAATEQDQRYLLTIGHTVRTGSCRHLVISREYSKNKIGFAWLLKLESQKPIY